MTPSDVADLAPYGAPDGKGNRCPLVLIEPQRPDGFIAGTAFYVEYNKALYPVQGRVLATNEFCTEVEPGDVVRFRPLNYTDATTSDGRNLFFIDERAILAVIDGYDDLSSQLAKKLADDGELLA